MGSSLVRRRVVVAGLVQGVFFRASTARMAGLLGLSGWVRNLPDGRVEAVFEGEPGMVLQAVNWMREGPSHARVETLDTTEELPEHLSGFSIG